MKKHIALMTLCGALILTAGCASNSVEMVDTRNDTGAAVAGIDYRDFENAASKAVQSLLASGAVTNPKGGRYVLMISRMTNDTMQRIDTDQLVKKIRVDLLNSGRVVVTTAVGANGPEDAASMQTREALRGNAEFDQSRVQRKGTLQAPDLSLSGKIIQRNVPMSKDRVQIEYYFQLSMTDLSSGLAVWEQETPIIKRARGDTATW